VLRIESQLREGAFSTPSEYIRSPIRVDQEHASRRAVEAFVRGGFRGRDLPQLDHEYWRAIQAFVVQRITAQQKTVRLESARSQ